MMKYLDMTERNPTKREVTLSDSELIALIKSETGRDLIFEDKSLQANYNKWFKLVRMPEPIGFLIVANERIPANTWLCPYGGQSIAEPVTKSIEDYNKDIEYLLINKAINDSLRTHYQQAKVFGDLGALFSHLPTPEFLNQIALNPPVPCPIQMANVSLGALLEFDPDLEQEIHRLYLVSDSEIPPGTVLGIDYGLRYWMDRCISPVFFKNGSLELLDNNQLTFRGRGVFCDLNGSSRLINARGKLQILGFDLPTILKRVKEENLGNTAVLEQSLEKNTPGAVFDHEIALTKSEVLRSLKEQYHGPNGHPVLSFFRGYSVVFSCEPPPNSEVIDGRTVVRPNM